MVVEKVLAIVGAGGHGRVIAEAALDSGSWSSVVFIDDDPAVDTRALPGEYLGPLGFSILERSAFQACVVGIGNSADRCRIIRHLQDQRIPIGSVVHPSAVVSKSATLGPGTVVLARSVVSSCARLGEGVIVNSAAVVEHDCVIGDYAHISPGAILSGSVNVGTHAWVGVGASVKDGIRIGRNTIVGVGAAVVSNIEEGVIAVGVPAKPMTKPEDHAPAARRRASVSAVREPHKMQVVLS